MKSILPLLLLPFPLFPFQYVSYCSVLHFSTFQVIDNGEGVSRKDFDLVGQRYVTSKCHTLTDLENNLQHLGYRGEALASIVDTTGTVEITSRHHLSQQTYSKLFYHGRPTPITISSSLRPSVGTTITLHDFFYNLPVRRRSIPTGLEMENLRQTIQCLSLVNPSVSFSLRNDALGECVMQSRRTNSLMGSFSVLFGTSKARSMREVSLKHGTLSITGIVSINSHYSKLLQFIFINGRVVKKTPLHSCVNNLVANSLITRHSIRQDDPSKWHNNYHSNNFQNSKRATERHAVYVLMIVCPRADYDICFDPAKTLVEFSDWEVVLSLLTEVVQGFLHRHCLTLGPECVEDEDRRGTQASVEVADSAHKSTPAELLDKSVWNGSLSCFQSELKRMSFPMGSLDPTTTGVRNEGREGGASEPSNDSGSVFENEATKSMDVGDEMKSRKGVVRQPAVSLKQAPTSSLFPKLLRSPLHCHSLSSKLSRLLKGREERVGEDDQEGHTCGAQSTSRSHHPLPSTTTTTSADHTGILSQINSLEEEIGPDNTCCYSSAPAVPSLWRPVQPLSPPHQVCEDLGGDSTEAINKEDCPLNVTHETFHNYSPASFYPPPAIVPGEECDNSGNALSLSRISRHIRSDAVIACAEAKLLSPLGEKMSDNFSTESHHTGVSVSSLWKRSYDPLTAKRVYIHRRTGRTSTISPDGCNASRSTLSMGTDGVNAISSSDTFDERIATGVRNHVIGCTSEDNSLCSSSYGSRPPPAAPHLICDLDGFLPSTKRLRMEHAPTEAYLSTGVSWSEGHGGGGKERRRERLTGEGWSFERLLQSWRNPSFLAGQEVTLECASVRVRLGLLVLPPPPYPSPYPQGVHNTAGMRTCVLLLLCPILCLPVL